MLRPVLQAPRPAQATTTSAAMRPLSFPTLSGMESGLVTQASPQLMGGMSGPSTPRASPLPLVRRGAAAYFAEPVMVPAGSTPFPSPRVGSGRSRVLSPSWYLGVPSMTAGQAQGNGAAMETEGENQTPEVSTVMTGAPSTTSDQDPAQSGS